jgi:catechol 2,3-dioxygenase-like lactoylglutathione lyase family enzyme
MWSIHHVNLAAPRLDRTRWFLSELVGLPEDPRTRPDATHTVGIARPGEVAYFGGEGRGIHAARPSATFPRVRGLLHNPTIGGHVAITVGNLDVVAARLDRASIAWSDAGVRSLPGVHQLYVHDPSFNLIEFNAVEGGVPEGVQPWENAWGWGIHHVNLMAHDVRETAAFFAEIGGMEEGRWTRPQGADESAFSIDPAELTIFPLGAGNRGLHIIRPDPLFGRRNGFVVNPSIGGHPAIMVPDLPAVMARMDAAGWHYDDAGVYAMPGMHQIYTYDPAMNVVEINSRVG